MLKVRYIAETLEVTIFQVYKYIKNGHLKSRIVDDMYLVEEKDFQDFYENYFINRNSKKGFSEPTIKSANILKEFVFDIFSQDIDPDSFMKKYKDIDSIIPPLKDFYLFHRNLLILEDRKKMKLDDLASKYNLSISQIKRIVKKSKERSN